MSRVNADHDMARCCSCGSDLAVQTFPAGSDSGQGSDGKVYCTNVACGFNRVRYPIGAALERGRQVA